MKDRTYEEKTMSHKAAVKRIEELSEVMLRPPILTFGDGCTYLRMHLPMTSAVLTYEQASEFLEKLDEMVKQMEQVFLHG